MLKSLYVKYQLQFKFPAGTSRGTLIHKETWFLKVWDNAAPDKFGLGECALFRGLSIDDRPDYEAKLQECCHRINDTEFLRNDLIQWPSIRFGLETALQDLQQGGARILFPSKFTRGEAGIPINGLIWMGEADFVKKQITEKLDQGYRCLKMKIGAMYPEVEFDLLRKIRMAFSPDTLEIRLDANGAYEPSKALDVLHQFASFSIHSVEQPIKPGNVKAMAELCKQSPIPVALDEELIGINTPSLKQSLLTDINPQYIILKPALTGGFTGALEWITEARRLGIGWWITSTLESNVGLNAIAQWAYSLNVGVTQGLGTGNLYTNNIPSPLFIKNQEIRHHPERTWNLSGIGWNEK